MAATPTEHTCCGNAGWSSGLTYRGEGTGRGQRRKQLGEGAGWESMKKHLKIGSGSTRFRWWIEAVCYHSAAYTLARAEPGVGEAPALALMVPTTWNALALDPSRLSSSRMCAYECWLERPL